MGYRKTDKPQSESFMKPIISFDCFNKVDIRIGKIITVNDFPQAHKPAYQLTIDFGALGFKKTSAQITQLYSKKDLLHKQVLAVVNFKPKQIANFISECLVLGIKNKQGAVVLLTTNHKSIKKGTVVR